MAFRDDLDAAHAHIGALEATNADLCKQVARLEAELAAALETPSDEIIETPWERLQREKKEEEAKRRKMGVLGSNLAYVALVVASLALLYSIFQILRPS
jgi:hypothetical protein